MKSPLRKNLCLLQAGASVFLVGRNISAVLLAGL